MNKLLAFLILLCPIVVFAAGNHAHEEHGHGHHHHHESPAGLPGKVDDVDRTIEVELMDSMKFKFAESPKIGIGETIKFVVKNTGKIPHEFSIGTEGEHEAHRKMMRMHPDMKHEDGNTIVVAPGKTGTLIWKFGKKPVVIVACNIPGHFEAGMKFKLQLSAKQ